MTLEELQGKYPDLPVESVVGPVMRNDDTPVTLPEVSEAPMADRQTGIPARQPTELDRIQEAMARQQLDAARQELNNPVRQLEETEAQRALRFQQVQDALGQIGSILTPNALETITEPALIDTGESSAAASLRDSIVSVLSQLSPEDRAAIASYYSTEGAGTIQALRTLLDQVKSGWGNIGGNRMEHSKAISDIIAVLLNQQSGESPDPRSWVYQ
jgi:hypothetical protein